MDGGWSGWGPWGGCSKTCGGGSQARARSCTAPRPSTGGAACAGEAEETRACGGQACPVAGGWGAWGPWGGCSVSCGGGTETRDRWQLTVQLVQ